VARPRDAVFKAFDELAVDDAAGRFSARVAVFDTIDLAGDRIRPGAFQASLKQWAERPGAIPVIWGHQWDTPLAVLGKVLRAVEDDRGLVVEGQLDLEHHEARRTHALLKTGTINAFSFAFRVLDSALVPEGDVLVRDITQAHVLEVGPCVAGMNGHAGLLAVKSLDAEPSSDAAPVPARPRLEAAARVLALLTLRAAVAAGKDG
jgi:HK97 family phage prohead protease